MNRFKLALDVLRGKPLPGSIRMELTPAQAEAIGRTFEFKRVWTCGCGAQLKVRARDDRADGPSNFVPYPGGHPLFGHSMVKSALLTWNGLAEERGWKTEPIACPACQAGMPLADYKQAKRDAAANNLSARVVRS